MESFDRWCVLRLVGAGELQNCPCSKPAQPTIWVPGEVRPRCFDCVKPIQEISRLPIRERWQACAYILYQFEKASLRAQVVRSAAGSQGRGTAAQ